MKPNSLIPHCPRLILALILLLPSISLANEAKETDSKVGIFTSEDLGSYLIELIEAGLKEEFDQDQADELAQFKRQIKQGKLQDGYGLVEPYVYLKGKFPQQRLQRELKEMQDLFEEATGGGPLPQVWHKNYQATQEAEADPELLILILRFGSMLRQKTAIGIEAAQTPAEN